MIFEEYLIPGHEPYPRISHCRGRGRYPHQQFLRLEDDGMSVNWLMAIRCSPSLSLCFYRPLVTPGIEAQLWRHRRKEDPHCGSLIILTVSCLEGGLTHVSFSSLLNSSVVIVGAMTDWKPFPVKKHYSGNFIKYPRHFAIFGRTPINMDSGPFSRFWR